MPLEMLPLPQAGGAEPSEQSPAEEGTAAANTPASVRLLTPEEIASLKPMFEEREAAMPNPDFSCAVGIVDSEGKVRGFLFAQMQIHAEPMWIEKGSERYFLPIVAEMEKVLAAHGGCDVFLFSPAGKTAMLAEKAGMRLEPWMVWSKHVEAAKASEEVQ